MSTPLKFIEVQGDARNRGVALGKASKHQITHSLSVYKNLFELCDISWQQAQTKAVAYKEVVQSTHPALLEELDAIAQGGGFDPADLFTLNCRTEILPADFLARAQTDQAHLNSNSVLHANECTSFALNHSTQSPVWLSQNWDWIGLQRQALIVVRAKTEHGDQFITVTEAGMLAKIGMNNHGFGVCLNILRSNDDGTQPGLPVHFLLRLLLECKTVDQASTLITASTYASSSNVMIADSSGAMANFELSPRGAHSLDVIDNTLCHTNHFLHPALVDNDAAQASNLCTTARLDTASAQLPNIHNLEHIKSLLSDTSNGLESICRFPDTQFPPIAQVETVAGVVMNLSNRELWVSDAQPSVSEFRQYTL